MTDDNFLNWIRDNSPATKEMGLIFDDIARLEEDIAKRFKLLRRANKQRSAINLFNAWIDDYNTLNYRKIALVNEFITAKFAGKAKGVKKW